MKGTELLRIRDLSIGYGRERFVREVSARFAAGELVALIGRNGVGKSTLLHVLGGLLGPLAGEVLIKGASIHRMPAVERARHVSMVLSARPVLAGCTVREVVSMGRQPWTGRWGSMGAMDERQVEEAMRIAEVMSWADRPMDELSDGQRQQAMLARALAQATPVLLLDEPTAHLDLVNQRQVNGLLRSVAHEQGVLVMHATHDLTVALSTSDRIILLPGDGGWCVGTPAELLAQGVVERIFGGVLPGAVDRS